MDNSSSTLQFALGVGGFLLGVGVFYATQRKSPAVFLDGNRKKLTLLEKKPISPDAFRLKFSLGSSNTTLGLPHGQHMVFHCPNPVGSIEGEWNGKPNGEKNAEIMRKYTPISDDKTSGSVEFVIKMYRPNIKPQFVDGGRMSRFLDNLQIGESLEVKGPVGKVIYYGKGNFKSSGKQIQVNHVGMIAGGSGITPVYQVTKAILENPEDKTKISLLYANQTEEDILLRKELEAFKTAYPDQFEIAYTLDRPNPDWGYETGFVTAEMIEKYMPAPASDVAVAMCGPPAMVQTACIPNLKNLGYSEDSYFSF
uniref:NADH-cytochrome b5 reductase n=1 Tax=Nephromyces sp. MMRI TaxID=2496275 RepID=A0A3Q8UBN4_9APIC|nr:NADH-dependent fumarate reductase [Nephromyces sp. MMRI]AZL94390.1 NADH-dependent fumarate reductase [Nephromyces sp. MMRI]